MVPALVEAKREAEFSTFSGAMDELSRTFRGVPR